MPRLAPALASAALAALAACAVPTGDAPPAARDTRPPPTGQPAPTQSTPTQPAQPSGASDPWAAMLLRAADADASHDVTAAEWTALAAPVPVHPDASMDRTAFLARVLEGLLDADRDGRLTGRDVDRALASLDADGSGTVEPEELLARPPAGAAGGRISRNLAPSVIGSGADTDGDGRLDREEWRAAIGGSGAVDASTASGTTGLDAPLPGERVAAWIEHAGRQSSEGPQDFGPATFLLSLRSALDATHDTVFDRADLDRLFADLDADGNGTVSAEELGRRGGPTAKTPWVEEPPPPAVGSPLMPWQRSLDDALALSRQTGKPLLLCVNVDGEAASETFAAGRYRDPAFVKLVAGFIPVLASPNRRTPRDHDDRGRRIPDPEFGRVLDSELIGIEPALFERFFHGQRVAPRHVGVAPDGTILFDLYLLTDLGVVDEALARHGRPGALPDPAAMDEAHMLENPDATVREALERRFAQDDEAQRAVLAQAALDRGRAAQQPEILRLALRDESPQVRRAAVVALAAHAERAPVDLLADVLPDAMRLASSDPSGDASLTHALAEGLARLAASAEANDETRTRALRASRLLSAAAATSAIIDAAAWKAALALSAPIAPDAISAEDEPALYAAVGALDERLGRAPNDEALRLQLAEATLRAGSHLMVSGSRDASFMLADSQQAARQVAGRQPGSGRAWAVLAAASLRLGELPTAADAAARALPLLPADTSGALAGDPLAADALDALQQGRARALGEALAAGAEWPPAWLADVAAACELLIEHPRATEAQCVSVLNSVGNLELYAVQGRLVRRALQRFPDSAPVHAYFRWQVLRDEGAAALSAAYEQIAPAGSATPMALWFAGLANLKAAERHRENREPEEALAACARSIERSRRSVELNPDFGNALDNVALAHAAAAQVELERGKPDAALQSLRDSVLASVAGFTTPDGLGATAATTASALLGALRRAGRGEQATALAAFLAQHEVAVEESPGGR